MITAYLRRGYTSFATHVLDVPPRLLAFLLLLILVFYPITRPTALLLRVLILASIMSIFAASWDLLVGRSGQISLGHALFFGIGAYGTALLYKFHGLPPWVTIPVGMFIGILVAVAVGFPCIRVKGPYLALVTMALPLIAISIVFMFADITGGESGIRRLPSFFPIEFFTERGFSHLEAVYMQRVAVYYFTLLLLLISSIILYKLANSKTGIVLVSILDDELASKCCGINVTKYKLMAFIISGLFASLAGGVYAHFLTFTNWDAFSLTMSFMPIIFTIFGGMGTIYGPIVGTYVLTFIDRYILTITLNVPAVWHLIIFAIPIIILIIKWPRGIARFVTDELEDLEEARDLDERGPRIWKKYKRKKESTHEG